MRDHDHRAPGVRLGPQEFEDLNTRPEVEIARRLVGEQQRVAGGQRSRDGDALLLTTGQLVRIVVQSIRQTDLSQHVDGPSSGIASPCE